MPTHDVVAASTDPVSQLIVGATLVLLFALLTLEKAHRVLIALGAVSLLWAVSYLTPYRLLSFDAAQAALDLNVLLLLAGMMAVVGVLKATGVFEWSVGRLLGERAASPALVLSLLVWATGIASAFLDNVTTVIFVTPIAWGVAQRLGVDARAFVLPVIMAANIGGAATLIGDPPNIMVGSAASLPFTAFLVTVAPPVLVMMVVLDLMMRWRYRGLWRQAASAGPAGAPAAVITDPRLLRGMAWISAGILVGFLTHGLTGMPAAVPAVIGAAAALILQDTLYLRTHRPSLEERRHGILSILEHEIEWPTLVFFALLFMVVGAAVNTGVIGTLATALRTAIVEGSAAFELGPMGTMLFAAILILWVAGILSALVDNIPFVAVSIPIVADLNTTLAADSTVLWWALALGACLGGNGTPIGASANVTTLDLAARRGVRISFRDYLGVGVPVLLVTLMLASAWLVGYVRLGNAAAAGMSLALAVVVLAVRWLWRGPNDRGPNDGGPR